MCYALPVMLRGSCSCAISERPTPSPFALSSLFRMLSPIIPVHPRNAPVSPIIPAHTQKQGGGGGYPNGNVSKICRRADILVSGTLLAQCGQDVSCPYGRKHWRRALRVQCVPSGRRRMELFTFVRFHVRAGQERALEEALREIVPATREEAGCLEIHAFRSLRDAQLFYIHSRWKNEEEFELHASLPHTVKFLERARRRLCEDAGARGKKERPGTAARREGPWHLTDGEAACRLTPALRGLDLGQIQSSSINSGENMRKVLWATLFVVMLLSALPMFAQSPNYDVGPVWRVTYYHIKPGQGDAFWKDFRENLKPLYEAYKKEGFITDYKAWTNATTDGPNDWDIAVGILFPNYAAFDQIDAKAMTIVIKHYGSRDTALDAVKKRSEIREVVMSKLAREVMPK